MSDDDGAASVSQPANHSESAGVNDATGAAILKNSIPHFFHPDPHTPQVWGVHATINKCWGEVALCEPGAAYEVMESDHNTLLTAGANALWQGLTGGTIVGGTYNTTNGALAVSDAGGGTTGANVADQDVAAGGTTVGTSVSTATWTSGTVTVTTSAAANLSVGQVITVSGVSPSGYNGTFATVSGTTGSTVKYSVATNPGTYSSGGTVKTGSTVGTPTALSESGTTVTVTVSNSLVAGQVVQLLGMTPSGYNGTWVVASAGGSSFTYTNTTSGLGAGSAFGPVLLYNKYRQQANASGSGVVTNNQVVYVATFGTTNANYAWSDWSLDNSGTSQAFANIFNHAFPSGGLGTKTSSASWTLTVTLTLQ